MKKPGKTPEKRTNGRVELLSPNQRRWVMLSSRLLPDWTAARAERLLQRPPRKRGRAGEVLDAWGCREDVALGKERIAVWDFGPGEAPRVLLVHGWGGYGAQFAQWIRPLLSRGLAVTVFDMPGHGESTGRAGRVDEFMRAIECMLARSTGIVGLAAHSMGGAASIQMLRRCRALSGVVVIAAPASLAHHVRDLSTRVGLGCAAHHSLVGRLESSHRPVAELDDLSDLPVDATRALFIHDREDAEVDFAHLARFEAVWPGCETLATAGLGHYRVLSDSDIVERGVAFLADASAARAGKAWPGPGR
jgi:pimeloyl-ACP methyl ester carboxylesterase